MILIYNDYNSHATFVKKGGDIFMLYAPIQKAQGLVEYALIIAFIAMLIILALGWVTGGLISAYSRIASSFP